MLGREQCLLGGCLGAGRLAGPAEIHLHKMVIWGYNMQEFEQGGYFYYGS